MTAGTGPSECWRLPHPTSRAITADVRTRSRENALPTMLNKATLRLCVTEAV